MKKLPMIAAAAALTLLTACGGGGTPSVDRAIEQMEAAIEQVEANKDNMTMADWEALNKQLEEPMKVIGDAIEQNRVGALKKGKILMLGAKWSALMGRAATSTLKNEYGIDAQAGQTPSDSLK